MMRWLCVILLSVPGVCALGQTPSSDYQPGTITAVTVHHSSGQHDADITQYDVSVKVGNVVYVVLYSPPNGSNTVKYVTGDELPVLVGSKTITFNTALSGKTEVPILSRTTVAPEKLNASQACGQYSSIKLQHLSASLSLTDDQQAQIKPTLEQEAAEVEQICYNPVLSPADTLNQYLKILRASDEKIKPLLSKSQIQKLQDLRKDQKQELKKMIAAQKSSQQS